MNKKKLLSIMVLNNDNQRKLATYLDISQQTLSNKLNESNGAEFTQSEINKIKMKYELSPIQINEIFFEKLVS